MLFSFYIFRFTTQCPDFAEPSQEIPMIFKSRLIVLGVTPNFSDNVDTGIVDLVCTICLINFCLSVNFF